MYSRDNMLQNVFSNEFCLSSTNNLFKLLLNASGFYDKNYLFSNTI